MPRHASEYFTLRGRILVLVTIAVLIGCQVWPVIADEQQQPQARRRSDVKFHIVGYLPEYRIADFDLERAESLTDLVCFSAKADPAGDLNLGRLTPAHLQKLKLLKDNKDVALHLCVGGWERSEGFPRLAAAPKAREKFAESLVRFCLDNKFDGVDLDWEHPQNETEHRDYAALLTVVKESFQPHGLQLTIAVAGWQALPAEAIEAVDRVHLMAYDANGRHSTFDFAEADVARLMKRGVPAEKICLGLPFYGRELQDRSKVMTYAEIVKKFQPAGDVDEVNGLYFNGPATIERKTKFALSNKLGGVMIWEIGQDVPGERSLLRTINRAASSDAARP
jgi:chitinase